MKRFFLDKNGFYFGSYDSPHSLKEKKPWMHEGINTRHTLNRQGTRSTIQQGVILCLCRRGHKHQDTLLFHSSFGSGFRLSQASPLTIKFWGCFLSLTYLTAPRAQKQTNRKHSLLCQRCVTHWPKKGALSFQDTHDIIKKKHYPSIPVHVLMRQFAVKSLCCHVHLQNYRNFSTKIVNEKWVNLYKTACQRPFEFRGA